MDHDFATRGTSSIYEPMSWTHDNDGRRRRDSKTAVNTQPPTRYDAQSPSRIMSYSPTNGNHPASPYEHYSSRPSTSSAVPVPSAHSPRHAHLPSPKMNGSINHSAIYDQREGHNFYDTTADHRESQASWNPHYHVSSPTQVYLSAHSRHHYIFITNIADENDTIEPGSLIVRWLLSRSTYITFRLPFPNDLSIPSSLPYYTHITCSPTKPPRLDFAVATPGRG